MTEYCHFFFICVSVYERLREHNLQNSIDNKNRVFTQFFFFCPFFYQSPKTPPNDRPYNPPNKQEEELQSGLKYKSVIAKA